MQDIRLILQNASSWRSSVVEQLTCNQQVGGSTPFASSTPKMQDAGWRMGATVGRENASSIVNYESCILFNKGEVAEWTKAADCKSAGVAYVGSNPALPTMIVDFGFLVSGSGIIPQSAIPDPQLSLRE